MPLTVIFGGWIRIHPALTPLIFVMALCALFGQLLAQDSNNRPARAAEAADALSAADWRELEDGLELLEASTALGTRITAFKLTQGKFNYFVEQQNNIDGERANSVMKRSGGLVIVNGGFFGLRTNGALYPVGKLVDDRVAFSAPWVNQGGYLAFDEGGQPSIFSSQSSFPASIVEAIQTRPVLIEPGSKWAMRTNGIEPERRTLFCILPNGDNILMLVSGGGLTLFEAGWLFRSPEWGGVFDCDSAIALDGGGSTQLSVNGHFNLNITGLTRVQNFLVISKRME